MSTNYIPEEAHVAKEQVGNQKLKVETDPSEGLVRCNGRLSSTDYDVAEFAGQQKRSPGEDDPGRSQKIRGQILH